MVSPSSFETLLILLMLIDPVLSSSKSSNILFMPFQDQCQITLDYLSPRREVIASRNSSKSISLPSLSRSAIMLKIVGFFVSNPKLCIADFSSLGSIFPVASVSKRLKASLNSSISSQVSPGRSTFFFPGNAFPTGLLLIQQIFNYLKFAIKYNHIKTYFELRQIIMKHLKRTVVHISESFKTSSSLAHIFNQPDSLFPFLNSPLLNDEAIKKISFHSLEAQCDLGNIQNYRQSLPESPRKQFAFFGRSNVGKSSLLNSLIGANVASTSKNPGKTKYLQFSKLNTANAVYLVDCPGYGYASHASKQQINQWGRLVTSYLKTNSCQITILCLFDIEHGLKFTDRLMLDLLAKFQKKFVTIFTKCDRLKNNSKLQTGLQMIAEVQKNYQDMNFYVHFTSAKNNTGINQLRSHLLFTLLQHQLHKKADD